MRYRFSARVVAAFLMLAAFLSADGLLGAEQTAKSSQRKAATPAAAQSIPRKLLTSATANPSTAKTDTTAEKLKELGTHLGRALGIAVELFSGNEADLLSKNKTALLSGNNPKLLSGNNPKLLSGNTTPILSGNTFSVLSNIKVEIHIDNSGNTATGGTTPPPVGPQLKR